MLASRFENVNMDFNVKFLAFKSQIFLFLLQNKSNMFEIQLEMPLNRKTSFKIDDHWLIKLCFFRRYLMFI